MKISNLSKAYGEKQILKDLSLELDPGRLYILTGPSGSGKTTLLHILLGLVTPDSGEIPRETVYSAVFQENRLLPRRSAIENLRPVCRGQSREAVRGLLAQILPEDCLDQRVEALSGGMQRRVAIARAMAAQSEIILMDEPFTGLDADTAEAVIRFILRHQRGRAILIATHQPGLLQSYDPIELSLQ